jgi:hypothetical protein
MYIRGAGKDGGRQANKVFRNSMQFNNPAEYMNWKQQQEGKK